MGWELLRAAKMMEEVSMVVAYDAHVFGQLRDEDLLASLVAGSKPKTVVGAPPLPEMLKVYYLVPFFVLQFLSLLLSFYFITFSLICCHASTK